MSFQARQPGRCVICTFLTSPRINCLIGPASNARFKITVGKFARGEVPHDGSWSHPHRAVRHRSGVSRPSSFHQERRNAPVEQPYMSCKSKAVERWGGDTYRKNPIPPRMAVHVEDRAAGRKRLALSEDSTYGVFGKLLEEKFRQLKSDLRSKQGPAEHKAWGIQSEEELDLRLGEFQRSIKSCTALAERGQTSKAANPLFSRFRRAFVVAGLSNLGAEMKFAFISSVVEARFSKQDVTNQHKLADVRYPFEWFPATRAMHRTIHLHVGPTNSGKTYHALKRLEEAKTGIYAGPLRLLAHEVYSRFNAKGKSCMLVTGEERRIPEDGSMSMSSCTVEMVPLNKEVDVAVIDEIQMIADMDRGWAWTQAFLGVQAKEVHLCGELRTIQLVSDICAANGEKLVIHKYERLSPLAAERKSLDGNLKKLRKGDAIILFSRVGIHSMKADVEKVTGRRCAVVYGSLPPETRAQQAELFNNPDNDYDFLVASDAVGMGLNLSIKRVIFESVSKHDGVSFRMISTPELKQIAGRAGRYKSAYQASQESSKANENAPIRTQKDDTNGLVTTLERFDLPVVQKALNGEVEPLKTAGISPPADVLYKFASYFPKGIPFSYITLRLWDLAKLGELFHLCRLKEQIDVADLIEPYELSVMDRITFMAAPVALREPGFSNAMKEMAECVANQDGGELLDLKAIELELIDMDPKFYPKGPKEYLRAAELLHKILTLYLWLSYRFAGVFRSQALAFHAKSLVEAKIDECLADVHFGESASKQRALLRKQAFKRELAEKEAQQAKEGLGSVVEEDELASHKVGDLIE